MASTVSRVAVCMLSCRATLGEHCPWGVVSIARHPRKTMRSGLCSSATQKLIASVLLLAFAVRALVPVGFMPGNGRPLSIEICPEGFPVQLLGQAADHHHGGSNWHAEHCVFGSACTSGPIAEFPFLNSPVVAELAAATPCISPAIVVRLVYLPRARGPPTPA